MIEVVEHMKKDLDSIGSSVELRISGLPLGFGQPWYDGSEPALAKALMAIPAARAVEIFLEAKTIGKFHGTRAATTPTG